MAIIGRRILYNDLIKYQYGITKIPKTVKQTSLSILPHQLSVYNHLIRDKNKSIILFHKQKIKMLTQWMLNY